MVEKDSWVQPMASPAALNGIMVIKKVKFGSKSITNVEFVVKITLSRTSAVKGELPIVTLYHTASGTSVHSIKGVRGTFMAPSKGLVRLVQPGAVAIVPVVKLCSGQGDRSPFSL